jgi:hypothetical protein
MNEKEKTSEDMKELVIARLDVMPSNYKLSIGDQGTFTKSELISHVQADDSVGNQIVKMQLNFIRALTSGKLIQVLNEND